MRVNDYLTTRGSDIYHVTYWYQIGGRISSQPLQVKWWTVWNSLLRRRSDGGIVIVRAKIRPGESIDSSRARIDDFLRGVLDASSTHFPKT